MIEVREVRANPERMREAIRKRRVDPKKADLDRWLELDGQLREARQELEGLNAEKNRLAQLGKTDPNAARARGQELRTQSREVEERIAAVQEEWQRILDWFPNFPHPKMPAGEGEEDNLEECAWIPGEGYLPKEKLDKAQGAHGGTAAFMPKRPIHAEAKDFVPAHHADIGQRLGIDTAQAAKVSGTRFTYIVGGVARLQFAIQQLLIGHLLEQGFTPVIPPLLVRERALYGTSHFPEGREQVYQIASQNVEEGAQLYLTGTSEPSNFSYFMDKTLDEAELPILMFALAPAFRSEAGSWGKDQRGIKRVHQFDKIEMCAVCAGAGQAEEIYEKLRGNNEWLLQTLELPYRIVDKCGADAGYLASHRQRDVEAWLSGLGEYMEVMTDTNTSDYQARRLNIRYRPKEGGAPRHCWTLNDTGCALGRMIITIIDNYQQADGSVKVPTVLRAYVGKDYLRPT